MSRLRRLLTVGQAKTIHAQQRIRVQYIIEREQHHGPRSNDAVVQDLQHRLEEVELRAYTEVPQHYGRMFSQQNLAPWNKIQFL